MDSKEPKSAERIANQPRQLHDPFIDHFDEDQYLHDNPDVALAIARGDVPSGYLHYIIFGQREGRKVPSRKNEPRDQLIWTAPTAQRHTSTASRPQSFEVAMISKGGGLFIVGWADDRGDPLDTITIEAPGWKIIISGNTLARVRRQDVESSLDVSLQYRFGYYGFLFLGSSIPITDVVSVTTKTLTGITGLFSSNLRAMEDQELRDTVLTYILTAQHFGNPEVRTFIALGSGLGDILVRFNLGITRRVVSAPYVERFGPKHSGFVGSIIVCLYGKSEFLHVQAALYSQCKLADQYEFIFVSNSPELSEDILREARASSLIYGLAITIIILPGNAGFGAANNVAASLARSQRMMIVNPDVFPVTRDFFHRHHDIVDSYLPHQSKIFGASLFYDDGSMMHGGMYFAKDHGILTDRDQTITSTVARVEHYGKGAPPRSANLLKSRMVPAVTGAFISCGAEWWFKLGGFTEEYIFGHYEDADLCLKSLEAGTPVWVHNLRLWHLEGRGSTRRPVHDGASLVNRWLFTSRWHGRLQQGLYGQAPNLQIHSQREAPPLPIP